MEGGCKVYADEPMLRNGVMSASAVIIDSEGEIDLTSFGFKPNIWRRNGIGQCDAVIYPTDEHDGDAVLFVETKYSESDNLMQEYKVIAKQQIIDTIDQLKKRECPLDHRAAYGLISFPMLSIGHAVAFSPAELIDTYITHGVWIMVSNHVIFKDSQTVSIP